MYVVYIVVIVTVIHALESYVLNPKFMSSKNKLTNLCTFMILIFSKHFLGVWETHCNLYFQSSIFLLMS